MHIERITFQNRELINSFIINHWFTTDMILRGKVIDMTTVDGFFIMENNTIIGLVTYLLYDDILEITSLDSLHENQGIGTILLREAIQEGQNLGCKKIVLITTNDNINALRFYQKRGFDMIHLYHNALDRSRELKPEIPLIGKHDIPLRHEIEFEMIL